MAASGYIIFNTLTFRYIKQKKTPEKISKGPVRDTARNGHACFAKKTKSYPRINGGAKLRSSVRSGRCPCHPASPFSGVFFPSKNGKVSPEKGNIIEQNGKYKHTVKGRILWKANTSGQAGMNILWKSATP
jgi:hypothetical protein